MNCFIKKGFISFIFIFIIYFLFNMNIAFSAEIDMEIIVEKDVLIPLEEIEITLRLVNEHGELIKSEGTVLIRVNRGGLLDISGRQTGLAFKDGQLKFTYIAPRDTGNATLTFLELETGITKQLDFEIIAEAEKDKIDDYAVIASISNQVFVKYREQDDWDTAWIEDRLANGDSIKTMRNSWATLTMYQDTEVVLQPFSQLIINELSSFKENQEIKQAIFQLIEGTVICNVKDFFTQGSRFSIETESAAAGVRGTYFEVTYYEEQIVVYVYTGSISIVREETEEVFVVEEGKKIRLVDTEPEPVIEEHHITEEERKEQIKEEIKQDIAKEAELEEEEEEEVKSGIIEIQPVWPDETEKEEEEGSISIVPRWND